MNTHFNKACFVCLFCFFAKVTTAQTFTFSNAGASGTEGPTQTQIDSSYTATNLAGDVTINTRGIQEWIVPFSGIYKIEVWGAKGGTGKYSGSTTNSGLGAYLSGQFELSSGNTLKILVGQSGQNQTNNSNNAGGGGGGGGTFVIKGTDTPLIIAGGGGGGGGRAGQHGVNASFISSGTQTSNNSGTPGSNGQGGSGGGETWGSGGGGGFTSNGGNGGSPATGGFSFSNGGVGGSTKSMYAAIGGFGGGGGVAYSGGGGGGYSGGAGGISSEPYGGGGGGGSFNSGSNQESSSGHNIDHGKVVITFINTAYEFTNAGAIGREGPTQSEINTAYQGTNLENNVTVQTRGIQEWSVPFSGTYKIEVFGASGGDSTLGTAGKGASMSGNFTFNESQLLKIIPGQKGKSNSNHGGGGGGGSFVVNAIDSSLLIAAGGGGGAGGYLETTINPHLQDGKDAVSETSGTDAQTQGPGSGFTSLGQGGSSGSGGTGGVSNHPGGGGAGFLTDGMLGQNTAGYHAFAGVSFSNGFIGGDGRGKPDGGFGGGGSATWGGGGGGGYSGGGGGVWTHPGGADWGHGGGGGGSFNSGIDQNNTSGVNIGHGKIIITFLGNENAAPVISQGTGPVSKVISEDTFIILSPSELNATDADTNASQLSWSILTSPSHGSAIADGNGTSPQTFIYQPNANYHGSDSFSVMVSDGDKNDSITFNLTINQINDSPVISGDFNSTINTGTIASGDINASDPDGLADGSYFAVTQNPLHGSAAIDQTDGNWTYIPQSDFFGDDNFTVTITDDLNQTTTSLINIVVTQTASILYTFTNAGATGNVGPTQSQINLSYINTSLEGSVTIATQGFQEWTVPATGNYIIEAFGASGGSSSNSNRLGGKGAKIKGTFSLTEGTILKLVVGQEGTEGTYSGNKDYGGGGGTFVMQPPYNNTSALLIAAGGGGGAAGSLSTSGNLLGIDASSTQTGMSGASNNGGIGGSNGSGGAVSSGNAGAGAGFLANGGGSMTNAQGKTITNGALGGYNNLNSGIGGFGGGGGGWHYGGHGGGGGGFSGGGTGGNGYYGGGGGGSYNSGIDQDNISGLNTGHGKIIITLLGSFTTNETPSISQGAGPISKVTSEDLLTTWVSGELNATDIDTNSAQLAWSLLVAPSHGTAIVDGNGTSPPTFTYQPDANYHGSDSFSVMVSDGDANDSITINLTINPVDDPAIISGDFNQTIHINGVASGDLNASDIDGLNDGSYYTIFQNPSNGTASIHETDGNWTYSPNQDFSGTETFAVSITDDLNQSYIQIIGIVINEALQPAIYTFTNAGATGRTGPTQSSVNLSYAGTNLENNVLINTQGIQEWIVPATGSYFIEVHGASGGDGGSSASQNQDTNGDYSGGLGAKMSGYFSLESGEKLFLLVGQQGLSYFNYNGGGGGGTFVAKGSQLINATPLIVAGGGGGGGIQYNQDATTSESGLDAKTNNGPNSTGGSNGQGGQGAHLKARVVAVDFMGMDMVLSTINHTMAFLLETVD